MKSICCLTLSFVIRSAIVLGQGQQGQARGPLPYNPLDALDWTELRLEQQISDSFVSNCAYCNTDTAINNPSIIIDDIEFRRYDGIGNNIDSPHWSTTNSIVPRCIRAAYGDGFNSLSGSTRMGAREISNVISKQIPENSDKFLNERFLTQFAWQWGQFIDHDITLISEDKSALDLDDDIDIYIPCGDPIFDADDTCDADKFMELFRTKSFGTGTGINNPITGEPDIRQQFNEITGFIDASMIYGAEEARANELRTFSDGQMKEDDLGNLPKNENNFPNEPNDDPEFFIGGDVRVNEQLGLLTMHTIWVRFHNIIAERVAESVDAEINRSGVGLSDTDRDEKIFQFTRSIIISIVQKIVYKDWLPTLFGPTAMALYLGDYGGYNGTVNPGICPIFASSAYRLGHTFLPQNLPLRNDDCTVWEGYDATECPECSGGGIELKDVFFTPSIAEEQDGFYEALLNGYSCTLANEVDTFITEGVRNFLFFSSDLFHDLDLVAINIQRGREHGLPDYNSVRVALGLSEHTSFNDMTSKTELAASFEGVYGDINDVDLFLGGLAEDHFDDGSFGETISQIVLEQFGRLRDGDRFFYQNYIKPGELMDFINCISLKSIIELTTDIDNIDAIDSVRHNVFQNKRAISIFAGTDTFKAENIVENEMNDIPNHMNDYNHINNNNNKPQQPQQIIIELTNFQIFLLLISIIVIISICCYILNQFNSNRKSKYHPVKYDTETETECSDKEQLQI